MLLRKQSVSLSYASLSGSTLFLMSANNWNAASYWIIIFFGRGGGGVVLESVVHKMIQHGKGKKNSH